MIDVEIGKGDVPNRFIEATLVAGGRVHTEMRELFVPTQEGVVSVSLSTDKPVYRPGEEAKVEVTTTGVDGAPIAAQVALFAFDKSVLQIQPEIAPDIRAFFWGQRRSHAPRHGSSLGRQMQGSGYLDPPASPHWGNVQELPGWLTGGGRLRRDVDGLARGGRDHRGTARLRGRPRGRRIRLPRVRAYG